MLYCCVCTGGDEALDDTVHLEDDVAGVSDKECWEAEENKETGEEKEKEDTGENKETGEEEEKEGTDTTFWVQAWVRVDSSGNLVSPLEVAKAMPAGGQVLKGGLSMAPKEGTLKLGLKAVSKAKAAPVMPQDKAITAPGSTQGQAISASGTAQAEAAHGIPAPGTPGAMAEGMLASQMLQGLQEIGRSMQIAIKGAQGGKVQGELEEGGPKLALKAEAEAWVMENRKDEAERMNWPFSPNDDIPMSAFKAYLEGTLGQKETTVKQNVLQIRYFYGLFDLPIAFSQEGFIGALYQSGMAAKLSTMPILSSKLPHMANMTGALGHYMEHLLQEADRKSHFEASRCLGLFKREFIASLKTKVNKTRRVRLTATKLKAAQKLKALPPWNILQDSLKESMICLEHLSQFVEDLRAKGEEVNWRLKYIANTLMAGLIFGNSYAGRPGEWQALKMKHVQAILQSGQKWVLMEDHKTAEVYGAAGRSLPGGNWEALKRMLIIHDAGSELLLHPARPNKSGITSISKSLKKWSSYFFPTYTEIGATLQRKLMHSAPRRKDIAAKVLTLICRYDKHRVKTGLRNYVADEPEVEAENGNCVYEAIIGKPVPWPTEEEMAQGKKKALATIRAFAFRAPKEKAQKGEDAVEEGDEAEDEGEEENEEEQGANGEEEGGKAGDFDVDDGYDEDEDEGESEDGDNEEEEGAAALAMQVESMGGEDGGEGPTEGMAAGAKCAKEGGEGKGPAVECGEGEGAAVDSDKGKGAAGKGCKGEGPAGEGGQEEDDSFRKDLAKVMEEAEAKEAMDNKGEDKDTRKRKPEEELSGRALKAQKSNPLVMEDLPEHIRQYICKQHANRLGAEKKLAGDLAAPAWFKAFALVAFEKGILKDYPACDAAMVQAVVVAANHAARAKEEAKGNEAGPSEHAIKEEANPVSKSTQAQGSGETARKRRKKISVELENWILAKYTDALYVDGQRLHRSQRKLQCYTHLTQHLPTIEHNTKYMFAQFCFAKVL